MDVRRAVPIRFKLREVQASLKCSELTKQCQLVLETASKFKRDYLPLVSVSQLLRSVVSCRSVTVLVVCSRRVCLMFHIVLLYIVLVHLPSVIQFQCKLAGGKICYKKYARQLVADNKTNIRLWGCDVKVMVVCTCLEGGKVVTEENV